MAMSNHERVGKGLELLRQGLSPFVVRELRGAFPGDWTRLLDELPGFVGVDSRRAGDETSMIDRLDVAALFTLMWNKWNDVFQAKLGHIGRNYVGELRDVRNRWAHQQPFTADDAYRALDTATRLLQMILAPEVEETDRMAREIMRQRFEADARRELKNSARATTQTGTTAGLPAWREVVTPHPDVASGQYRNAEFAADLAQVVNREGAREYWDPVEFYRRTFITEGMKRLLTLALRRINGSGGDPVVQLETSFGGGKTHTMLALYHLFGGQIRAHDAPGLEELLRDAGLEFIPRAQRAVFVGTQPAVAQPRTKPDGTVVRTMWGDIAHQLGGPEGYALVAKEDERGVSPGSDQMKELFDRFGPALVLIDEWVAYARNIYGTAGLAGGSFESNMTFAQALTEGVKRSAESLVVASIPASQIEIGGEGGQAARERLEHTFGRLESVWKPASADESYEIVRRRLFRTEINYAARDAVVRAFGDMYRLSVRDFPAECREHEYLDKMTRAYPIHPELFRRLYEDWSTLERFQRTRGVLRLMASVIHELWEREDRSLLIMPGTLPLDSEAVRGELTQYLPDGWSAVVDSDVDGANSRPLAIDREDATLGRYSAARRVARALLVGSAPSSGQQRNRGLEETQIRVAVVQPGETAATFGDALRRLREGLTYLFADERRYWFDNRPSVNRLARERAEQMAEYAQGEIVRRIRQSVKGWEERFRREERRSALPMARVVAGVHVAPDGAGDVVDEQDLRLVILAPELGVAPGGSMSSAAAVEAVQLILAERGGGAGRIYRNRLVFLAADRRRVPDLTDAAKQFLGWKALQGERDDLNLDSVSSRHIDRQAEEWDAVVNARIGEAYQHLIVPSQQGTDPVELTFIRVNVIGDDLVEPVLRKLRSESQVYTEWAPSLLRMELERWFWRDGREFVRLKDLWDSLCRYLYLPRLRDVDVLVETVRKGVAQTDFALADRVEETPEGGARYVSLQWNAVREIGREVFNDHAALVHPDAAARQLDEERRMREEREAGMAGSGAAGRADFPERSAGGDGPMRSGESGAGALRVDGGRPSTGEDGAGQTEAGGAGAWAPGSALAGRSGGTLEGASVGGTDGGSGGGGSSGGAAPGAGMDGTLAQGADGRPIQGADDRISRASPSAGPTRFIGAVDLDSVRVGRDAARVAEEIILHLTSLVGAQVRVTLEIEADVPDGMRDQTVRILRENCRTLGFRVDVLE